MKVETKKFIKTLLVGVIMLAFGILLCFAQDKINEALSTVFGIIFMLGGLAFVVTSLVEYKRFGTNDGFTGAFLMSFGILFMVDKLGDKILRFIPFALICIGALLLFDAIIYIVKKNKIAFGVYVAIGAIALTIGILLLTIDGFYSNVLLVFGIVLIVYSILVFISAFIDLSKAKAKKKTGVVIDVKPTDVDDEASKKDEKETNDEVVNEVASEETKEENTEENQENA